MPPVCHFFIEGISITSATFAIPATLVKLPLRVAAYPGSQLFVSGLNIASVHHLLADIRAMLEQNRLRLRVLDAFLTFDFQWCDGAFRTCRSDAKPDLMIGV